MWIDAQIKVGFAQILPDKNGMKAKGAALLQWLPEKQ